MGKSKRSRSRTRTPSRERYTRRSHDCRVSKSKRKRSKSRSDSIRESLNTITSFVQRLNSIERTHSAPDTVSHSAADVIADAIKAIKPSASTAHYYVSNFDPNVNNADVWFAEVDKAKFINSWTDLECLSRVGHCLKGDAKSWLDEWVTEDRSWTNFKKEFKALCVNKIDIANILFDVMRTDSDNFKTYAEYARKSLLRLKIVRGLSDELTTAIILRGIKDPHVKATATNADLSPNELVNFLSVFVKPNNNTRNNDTDKSVSHRVGKFNRIKRADTWVPSKIKCFKCNGIGHKQKDCLQSGTRKPNVFASTSGGLNSNNVCSYCKKSGHLIDRCFAKQKSDQTKVNFCSTPPIFNNKDVTVAVIQGIPVDVLIDSGALDVSLISSSIVNHFICKRKPIFRELKGIGNSITRVNSYVTLTLQLEEISIEVDLLIVPSECMNAPIIIGTDVLNREGITYIRTKNAQRLTHAPGPARVASLKSNEQSHNIHTSLSGDYYKKLITVLEEFSDSMITGTATSTVNVGSMHIRLNSDVPVYYRPYKLSHDEKLKVREIIKDLLDKGVIRESESPYASPIILVKKKNGSDRMCVDFRALNKITIKDRYPLPLIDDCIDRLGKSKYFSTLDMATGFHQIRIDEASVPLTGFVTPDGHYEYLKMPYGLANAPVVYQRIISSTLRSFVEAGKALIYIDDCLILSSTVEEGLQTLRDILRALTDAGFSINKDKCSFLCTEIEYLGRIISNGQVCPSEHKIKALMCSPTPQNVKQTRQFLGLAGYFRKYIPNYATKTACIAQLTRKDVEFDWGPSQNSARKYIIERLTSEPILAIFDPNLPTEVHTDASSAGVGAVLIQIHEDRQKRVVAYYSQVTQGAESRYHSYELETLAVIKALRHFRQYLIGIKFKVVTDCNALKATQNKKDLIPRVARWWIYLQDFEFNIEYRKGSMLPHVDYLSRNPVSSINLQKPRNWAQIAQAGDEETRKMLHQLEEGQLDSQRYVVRNDVLYYRYVPVGEEARLLCFIPKGYRLSLLRAFHDEHEHINADKTIDLILKHFWFPGMRPFVHKYIAHCLVCISGKRVPRAPLQPITSWTKCNLPFHTLHVDVLGPLPESAGYKHVLVVIDAFTKYCLLYPIFRQDLEELKRIFKNVISLFGTPKLIVTDRGRMFESLAFNTWMKEIGCEVHHITPEMHHANGQVERYIRTVLNMLRIETNYKKKALWSDELWKMQLILNITKQKTTQTSPLNLLVGVTSATPIINALVRDIAADDSAENRESLRELNRQRTAERLKKNQAQQDKYVNKERSPPRQYKVDDFVFVIKYAQSKGKLDPGMRGPYRVTKVLENGRYELKLLSGAYGKTSYSAAQYMVPWKGEWTPEACAALFECDDNANPASNNSLPCCLDEPPTSAEDSRVSGEAV